MVSSTRELLNILFCVWAIVNYCDALPSKKYMQLRDNLINEEKSSAFGGSLTLQGDEVLANKCLMDAKRKEVDQAFDNPSSFLPGKNFLIARKDIERSEVFQIIRKVPKGILFHAHSSAIATVEFVIRNMTHRPNLYVCFADNNMRFRYFETPDKKCAWQSLEELRNTDAVAIDEKIKNYLLLAEMSRSDINDVWKKFENLFDVIKGLITYRPIFEDFFYGAMQELYDDNVMLMELRSSFSTLYELNGTSYDKVNVARIYKEVAEGFSKDHPGFLGAKVIYSPYRRVSQEVFDKYIETYRKVKAAYPDFVVGFDLVGQEDKGHTLLNFAEKLEALSKETQFFFHAGETNWYGHSTDDNLYDAVLLNTKRIGHGFALLKHPKLMEIVKQKHIAIELNPISNQVLRLVKDMRNHPAAFFFADDLPVVVSNDDPGFWGAAGLSYDFYEAFVGIMSREADLRALKQLALNSIVYSSLNSQEQKQAMEVWEKAWQKFVSELALNPKCSADGR